MVYVKTNWQDRVVEKPLTFNLQNNPDGTVTLIPNEGQIVQPGTPLTAAYLNNAEKQYDEAVALLTSQSILWTGNRPPTASQTTTPTKKLSECKTGWILVWSDFDPSPDNVANDFEYCFTFIPKILATIKNGASCMFIIGSYLTPTLKDYTNKRLSIFNDRIIGHDDNGYAATSSVDVTLRYILEY